MRLLIDYRFHGLRDDFAQAIRVRPRPLETTPVLFYLKMHVACRGPHIENRHNSISTAHTFTSLSNSGIANALPRGTLPSLPGTHAQRPGSFLDNHENGSAPLCSFLQAFTIGGQVQNYPSGSFV
jgi:hypothetical protein